MKADPQGDTLVQVVAESAPAVELTQDEQMQQLVEKLATRDPARRLGAARVLADAGSTAVPHLIAALDNASPEQREAIVSTLGLLGRKARAAIPALEQLLEDEGVGPTAREALSRIRAGFQLDRDQLLDIAIPCIALLLVLLTVAREVAAWLEVWGRIQGPGRPIALAWGGIGALAGYFAGANLGSRKLAWKAAQSLGVLGACGGIIAGRWVGEWIAPLTTALRSIG